jgi:hypothetical protein
MSPARIPPPSPDDIPRPVPSPEEPPAVMIELDDVPYDDEIEASEDFVGENTHVDRRCLECAGDFIELENDAQPPASYEEAWGRHGGRCRGTRDPDIWSWCRGPVSEGRLEMPRQGITVYFKDRRAKAAPIATDRKRK